MSNAHSHDEIKRHVKVYIAIFIALLAGTFITVWLNSVHFESYATTVGVALLVATVKATLVAGFFMHLISEKRAIYSMLAVTVFFFAAMMYLFIWSRGQLPTGSEYPPSKQVPQPAAGIISY